MDLYQLLVTLTLLVAIVFLSVVGYQLVKLIQEARRVLERVDRIALGLERMGTGLQSGFSELGGFFSGFSGILKVINYFSARRGKKSHERTR